MYIITFYTGSQHIALSAYGHPLTAEPSGRVCLDRSQIGDWEKFWIENHPDGRVSLRSFTGQYLSCEPDGSVAANRSAAGDWESFYLIHNNRNQIALQTCHGSYITATPPSGVRGLMHSPPSGFEEQLFFTVTNV